MTDERSGLEALGAPPPPRRTDDAFARSVVAAVEKRRTPRTWLAFPAIAAGAAAVTALVVARPDPTPAPSDDVVAVAPVADVDDVDDVEESDEIDEEDDDFAIATLDGSDEQELLAFESRLDGAIAQALANRKL